MADLPERFLECPDVACAFHIRCVRSPERCLVADHKQTPVTWRPGASTLAEAAASLMAVIDAEGGNPTYPHGGTPLKEALWHVCRHLLDG